MMMMPDKHLGNEQTGEFYASNDIFGGDRMDDIEGGGKSVGHEVIDLGERRKSSLYSGITESSSSVEVPKRNSTVDAGKTNLFVFRAAIALKISRDLSSCQKIIADVSN